MTPAPANPDTLEEKKAKRAKRQAAWRARDAAQTEAGNEIGPIPPVKNKRRRAQCEKDLQRALKIYFPRRFPLPFSRDHVRVIESIQSAAQDGMLLAFALPRGSGKTTICECAALLVALWGWHDYVALIAATQQHARKRIESAKMELRHNAKLAADFPEAVFPIRKLENITQRARGQRCEGKPTDIRWESERIVFPSIPGSPCSGGCLESAGLLGAVRGMNLATQDGEVTRPSFALIDDPQTRRSASSPQQCDERERILQSEILYLPGPGKKIAAVMPCTVVQPDDMADRILDPTKNPEWRGIRAPLVYAMPADSDKWDEYAQLRHEDLIAGGTGKKAKAFYRKHRKAMDRGAEVAWPEQVDEGDLSALQSAMNKYYRDRPAFFAEAQNDPGGADRDNAADELRPAAIAAKVGSYERGTVPPGTLATTAYIDVQKEVLFYVVTAWGENMTGHTVDYGTWPRQRADYFSLSNLRNTLTKKYPGRQLEGRLRAGLVDLVGELSSAYQINRGLVDAAWGLSRDTVYDFCAGRPEFWPSHGRYIGPGRKPMRAWTFKPGDLPTRLARRTAAEAAHWRSPRPERGEVRHVLVDVNFWKSYLVRRLATATGDKGALALFTTDGNRTHRLFADHLTAETRVEVSGPYGTTDDWRINPGRPDNHWLDCQVGAAVAASICGLSLDQTTPTPTGRRRQRQKVKYL